MKKKKKKKKKKKRQTIIHLSSAEFAQRAVKVSSTEILIIRILLEQSDDHGLHVS